MVLFLIVSRPHLCGFKVFDDGVQMMCAVDNASEEVVWARQRQKINDGRLAAKFIWLSLKESVTGRYRSARTLGRFDLFVVQQLQI